VREAFERDGVSIAYELRYRLAQIRYSGQPVASSSGAPLNRPSRPA